MATHKKPEPKKSIRSIPNVQPTHAHTKREAHPDPEVSVMPTRAAREDSVPAVTAEHTSPTPKAELKAKDAEEVKAAEPLVRTATRSTPRSPVEDHKNRQ